MSNTKTIQDAVLKELQEHGPASMVELTDTLAQFDVDDVSAAVRGLREDKIITLSSGVYRLASESGMRLPGSALVKKPATSPEPAFTAEPVPAAVKPEPADQAGDQQSVSTGEWKDPFAGELPDRLEAQIRSVAARLQPRPVDDVVLKIQVLEALAPLLAGDIGDVLLNIRDDLEGMGVAA